MEKDIIKENFLFWNMSFRIRKTINHLSKWLKEDFTTVNKSTDVPKKRTQCERLITELQYNKRYLENAIQQLEKWNHE